MLKLGMFWTFYLAISGCFFKNSWLGMCLWLASLVTCVWFSATNLGVLR